MSMVNLKYVLRTVTSVSTEQHRWVIPCASYIDVLSGISWLRVMHPTCVVSGCRVFFANGSYVRFVMYTCPVEPGEKVAAFNVS